MSVNVLVLPTWLSLLALTWGACLVQPAHTAERAAKPAAGKRSYDFDPVRYVWRRKAQSE